MPAHLIATEGPHEGLVFNLETGNEWIIGRDPDTCDWILEDTTVSRKQARLNQLPDGIYLKNLSRVNPTLVNGKELTEPLLLKEGDQIQIGKNLFVFSEKAIPKEAKAPQKEKGKKQSGYDDIFGDIEPFEEKIPSTQAEEEEPKIPPAPLKPEMTAYDTIFEDTGSEDLPFNLIPEAPLMLKVIAGPNAGAEIALEKGRTYIMGKDPSSCDIVFHDMSVSRNHAQLEVNEEGVIEIEDLGSKNGTAINGSLIIGKQVATSQDLVALGTTIFMIIDQQEGVQETIYSPIASSHEPPKITEDAPPLSEIEAEEEKKDWKKEPIPTKYLITAGSAAAIFLIMFLTFFSLFKSNHIEVAQKEPLVELKEALAKFSDVQYSYNPGTGKLFLVGHVLTPVEYQEMHFRLSQIPFVTSIEDTVIIDEGVWKMMNDLLSTYPSWRSVSIHSPVAGKFVVSGYINNIEDAERLSEYLTINFPYLDRLENEVAIEQNLNLQLQSLISTERLGTLTFQLSNGNIVLSGLYNETMESNFKDLLKQINKMKGITSVKNFALPAHADRMGINLSNQYQITGTSTYDGRGFSVVMNGKIYTLGDFVDGMKITSIERNTILLEKDGLKYKIDYTQ